MKDFKEIFENRRLSFIEFGRNENNECVLAGFTLEPITNKRLNFKFTRSNGWEHLSVSTPNKCPSWEQMCFIKEQFWKDDVYLKIRDTEYENKHIVVGKTPIDFGTYILKKDVIKQADTIEELCDEFVVAFEENNDKITYLDLDWAIDKAKRYAGHTTIYGAVWTDKGLIYVAKMNEKGELELI